MAFYAVESHMPSSNSHNLKSWGIVVDLVTGSTFSDVYTTFNKNTDPKAYAFRAYAFRQMEMPMSRIVRPM